VVPEILHKDNMLAQNNQYPKKFIFSVVLPTIVNFDKINVMKHIFLLTFTFFSLNLNAQEKAIEGSEIGVDASISASTIGGTFGVGVKYGLNIGKTFIVGPSARFQRSWSNNIGAKFGYNIYGGGIFAHARYQNVVFGGLEFEMLKSPINYVVVNPTRNWVPTLFLCGGFSREYNEAVRINVGIYYDIINNVNSPFRQGYFMNIKDSQTGQVVKILPIIYRISFFFPIGRKNKKNIEEEMED
jgi:hypothetical protein